MALSGTINGTTSNDYITAKIEWSATQNTGNNTSTITATLYYRKSSSASQATYGTLNGSISIDGVSTSVLKTVTLSPNNTWVSIGTATKTITHKDDGSRSVVIWAKGAISGTSLSSTDIGQTVTLNTIARATTPVLSNSSPTIGTSITITLNRASTAFTHTLTYTFGSASGTIGSGIATSKTWTVPTSFASQIPSGTSGTGTIVCQTYNGSTLIGTKSVSFTANLSSGAAPTINSVSISEGTEGLASKFGAYIKNKSKLKVSINASPSTGATIAKYETYIQAVPYSGQTFTSNLITTSGDIGVAVSVTDSRGFTATKSYTVTILDYSPPTISSFIVNRRDSSGAIKDDGTHLGVTFQSSITPLNNKNDKSWSIAYKESSAESWTTLGGETSEAEYSQYRSYWYTATTLDVNKAYDVQLTVTDYFGSVVSEAQVSTAFTIMDFRSTGKGMAIGKVSEKDRLEVAMESDFTKNVRIYAPTNTGTDDAFLRFHKNNENLLGFLSTYDNGSAIKLAMYDDSSGTNTYSGYVAIKKDGSMESSGMFGLPAVTIMTQYDSSSGLSLSTKYQKINLSTRRWSVNHNTELSSSGLKFNRAGSIMVSAQASFRDLTAGDAIWLAAIIGDDNITSSTSESECYAISGSTTQAITIAPKIIFVNKDDVLYLCARNTTSERGKVFYYPSSTYLSLLWLD